MRIGTRQLAFDVTVAAILALIILFLLMPATAHADDKRSSGTDVSTDVATSVITGDTSTVALSQGSLGDVDIYGCLASTQYSVFIFWARQGIKIDSLCVADKYDLAGKHQLAAQLRCQVPLIAGLDYAGTTCIEANTFVASHDDPCAGCEPTSAAVAAVNDERDERQYDIAQVIARQDELDERLKNEAATRRRLVNASNKRRAEDAEYAQQLIQKMQSPEPEHE